MAHSRYSDKHRAFMQFILHGRMISEQETLDEFSRLFGLSDDNISITICVINDKLKDVGFEIIKRMCEVKNKHFYIFTPVIKRSFSSKTSIYSQKEIDLYEDIVVAILSSKMGYVEENYALNAENRFKCPCSTTVNKFVNDNWFMIVDCRLCLTPLAIAELEMEFKEKPGICLNYCLLCNRIVVQGRMCQACKNVVHHHCFDKYALNTKSMKCPICSDKWSCDSVSSKNGNDSYDVDDE